MTNFFLDQGYIWYVRYIKERWRVYITGGYISMDGRKGITWLRRVGSFPLKSLCSLVVVVSYTGNIFTVCLLGVPE